VRDIGGEQKHLARLKHQYLALCREIQLVEIKFAFELVENFVTFVDVELFATRGPAVNHRDEVRVLPNGAAPAPILFVRLDPLLKVEFAQMWKHIPPSLVREYVVCAPRLLVNFQYAFEKALSKRGAGHVRSKLTR